MPFQADYFDGISARSRVVIVEIKDEPQAGIAFKVDDDDKFYPPANIRVEGKLGAGKRVIALADGGRLEAFDISELESKLSAPSHTFNKLLHTLENNIGWIAIALSLTIATGWAFLKYGVPKLAEYVVSNTPQTIETNLGEQVLAMFDHEYGYFKASKLPQAKKDSINKGLKEMCAKLGNCPCHRLEFRDGGEIGANALALPGGIMVVTDQLINLGKSDTEVVAVLAHELGHVSHRHAFRRSIQSVLSGLIIAALTGDVSSSASALSGFLLEMQYSQDNENQADAFALSALQKSCLPPRAYADILDRITTEIGDDKLKKSAAAKKNQDDEDQPISDMLSTHPNTKERIKPFLAATQSCHL